MNSDNRAANYRRKFVFFTSVVLTQFPDDEDGKLLLETIDTITLERKKGAEGTKKKTSKKVGT